MTARLFYLMSPLMFCASVSGAEQRDLLSLSLEELMMIEVTSQQRESIKHAPGIISTYRAEDLRKLGLKDLKDFIDFVPGVRVNETMVGVSPIAIRGLWDGNNQKILFLLDGVPLWSPGHADVPLMGIALASIDRIEVMRGPSAVIYGTNASAGVINVVTRRSGRKIEATLGDHGLVNTGGHLNFTRDESVSVDIGFEYQQEEGYPAQANNAFSFFNPGCMCFPADGERIVPRAEDKLSLLSKVTIGGFSAAASLFENSTTGSADAGIADLQKRTEEGQLLTAQYRVDTGNIRWNVFSDWNRYHSFQKVENITAILGLPGDGEISFDHNGNNNVRVRAGLKSEWTLNDRWKLMGGVEYENRSTEAYRYINYQGLDSLQAMGFELQPDGSILLIEPSALNEKAGYVQVGYNTQIVDFQLAGRYLENSQYGNKLLPRVSVVLPFADFHSVKAMYAMGYNSPAFRQTGATDQFGRPVENSLVAEQIESMDLAYTYTAARHHLVVNGFYIHLKDGISDSMGEFENTGNLSRSGFEVDYQFRQSDFQFYSGASYLISIDDAEATETRGFAEFTSRWQLKVGAAKQLANHTFGVSLRATDARKNVDAYYWVNASYRYRMASWEYSLVAENILSDDISYPDIRSGNAIVYQGVGKNRLSMGLTYRF